MPPKERMEKMRGAGVNPTMQRLAILEYLEETRAHPTADEVHTELRKTYPTIARATVYNTLDALTKAGTILQLTVDPAAARYDADIAPHVHFRCRLCGRLYDVDVKQNRCLGHEVDGHQIESIRTYAFGVCAACREDGSGKAGRPINSNEQPSKSSATATRRTRSQKASAPRETDHGDARKKTASTSARSRKGESPRA